MIPLPWTKRFDLQHDLHIVSCLPFSSDYEFDGKIQGNVQQPDTLLLVELGEEVSKCLLYGNISGVRRYITSGDRDQLQRMKLSQTGGQAKTQPERPRSRARMNSSISDSCFSSESEPDSDRGSFCIFGLSATRRLPKFTIIDKPERLSRCVSIPSLMRSALDSGGAASVTIPKAGHGKGHRLVVPSDKSFPTATVYTHGDIQFIGQSARYASQNLLDWSDPNIAHRKHIISFSTSSEKSQHSGVYHHVVDVYLLNNSDRGCVR
jgi:hypothetical protein